MRVSSEGVGTPVWQLPATAVVAPTSPTTPASPTPDPTGSAAPTDDGGDDDREGDVDRVALGTGLLVGGVGLAVLTWVLRRSRPRSPGGR